MSTITFTCYSCNQVLRVGADKAGKKAKCVKCGTILTIPVAAGDEAELVAPAESAPPPAPRRPPTPPPAPRRPPTPPPKPRARDARDDVFDDEPAPRRPRRDADYDEAPRRRPRDDYDDDFDEAPRRRPRDDYDDDYDRPRRKWGDWTKVQVGLLLEGITGGMLIGYAGLMLLAILFVLIWTLAASPQNPSFGLLRAGVTMAGIAMIIYFLLQIPAVVGYVFSLFARNKNGAVALAITSLSLGGVNLLLKIFFVLIPAFRAFGVDPMRGAGPSLGGPEIRLGGPAVTIILTILVLLLFDSEYIIYPLYLRAVGLTVKDRSLAGSAMMPLILACVVIGMKLLLMILALSVGAARGGGQAMAYIILILGIITWGLTLGFALVYMRTALSARGSV